MMNGSDQDKEKCNLSGCSTNDLQLWCISIYKSSKTLWGSKVPFGCALYRI